VPLSIDNIIQTNTGSFNASTGSATLPSAVTSGSTVVIFAGSHMVPADGNVQVTAPAGFENIAGFIAASGFDGASCFVWAKRNVTDGSSSWTLTAKVNGSTAARAVCWVAIEVTGVGLDPLGTGNLSWYASHESTLANAQGSTDVTTIDTLNTNSTSRAACYDTLGLAVFAARSNNSTIPTWSNYGDGWLELAQVGRTDTLGLGLAVAYKPSLSIGWHTTTADVTPTSDATADSVSLYADGARHAHLVQMMTGAEFGSATGSTVTYGTNGQIFDSVTANATCVTNIKRTGNYALKLNSSAAASNFTWSAKLSDMTNRALCARLNVYFDSSLPGIDVELASFEVTTKTGTLTYRTASQKLEVKVGTGTAVLSDTTVSANQWVGVDLRYDSRGLANAQHICDWQVDYNAALADTTAPVAQTQAVGATTTAGAITLVRFGWTQSITATVYMDDLAVSRAWGAYPLGDLRIRPLKVDSAGTPTVTGATTNFNTWTNNGTMAAWNATTARNALLDVPPTIGGSSSGVAQVALVTGVNETARFPMETYDAAGNSEAIRAVGHYAAGWAAATQPANIGLGGDDGRSSPDLGQSIGTGADANWDSSNQFWIHWMHHRSGDPGDFMQVRQTDLDNMSVYFGNSTDAAPDIGVHCLLTEVATEPLKTWPVSEVEGGAFTLYGRYDPVDSKIPALVATTPSGTRGATVSWAIQQVDQTPQYVNPGQVQTFVTGAESVDDVTSISFLPDAEPEV
jgi:hypothetical protein